MTPAELHKISDQKLKQLEDKLRKVASELFADGSLKPSEYTFPVLGLIFLKYADEVFQEAKTNLEANKKPNRFGTIDQLSKIDFQSQGVIFVPEMAGYNYLLHQPE
jgi:type I restriction enzyme M protein